MDNELLTMKRNAVMLGLCGKYKGMWDNAESKKSLMDIALDANGVEFLCEACTDGWGLSTEFLLKEFSDYVNGNYMSNRNGYTSAMYVGYGRYAEMPPYDGIVSTTTLTVLIDCTIFLTIPKYTVCKIYVCRGCDIEIKCSGKCDIYVYGNDTSIVCSGDGTFTRHDVKKGTWAKSQRK